MKHQHSPNFLSNLEETENTTFDRGATIKWTLILIVTFLIGILATSCTKEVSKPIKFRPPTRQLKTHTITAKLWQAQQSWGKGWLIQVTMEKKVTDTTRVTIAWKDDATAYSPTLTVYPGFQQVTAAIWWEAKGNYRDVKLLNVEGEKNVFYTIKIVP